MKNTIIFSLLGLSLLLNAICLVNIYSCKFGQHASCRGQHASCQALAHDKHKPHHEKHEEVEEIELADVMATLQRHSNKLWFAGEAHNWELAGFYVHELEEAMEIIEHNNIVEEGVNLSSLIEEVGLEPLEEVEKAVKTEDPEAFLKGYNLLITNCNNCHRATKHEFIVITTPKTPLYDSQQY